MRTETKEQQIRATIAAQRTLASKMALYNNTYPLDQRIRQAIDDLRQHTQKPEYKLLPEALPNRLSPQKALDALRTGRQVSQANLDNLCEAAQRSGKLVPWLNRRSTKVQFNRLLLAGTIGIASLHYVLMQDDPNDLSDDKMGPTERAIYSAYKLLIDKGIIDFDEFVAKRLKKEPEDYVANSLLIWRAEQQIESSARDMEELRAEVLNSPAPDMSKGLFGPADSQGKAVLNGKFVNDTIDDFVSNSTITEKTAIALKDAWIEATKAPVAADEELSETNVATTSEKYTFRRAAMGIMNSSEANYTPSTIQTVLQALTPL